MGIEEKFYERFDLVPDKIAMAYLVKTLDKTVTEENYPLRKAKVLANILKQAPMFEEMVQDSWKELRELGQKQYSDWIRKQAENN